MLILLKARNIKINWHIQEKCFCVSSMCVCQAVQHHHVPTYYQSTTLSHWQISDLHCISSLQKVQQYHKILVALNFLYFQSQFATQACSKDCGAAYKHSDANANSY